MQEHKNDCTRSFVVRHVGKARLVSLDTLASTCSTGSTKSNVSSRVESSQLGSTRLDSLKFHLAQPSGIWAFVVDSIDKYCLRKIRNLWTLVNQNTAFIIGPASETYSWCLRRHVKANWSDIKRKFLASASSTLLTAHSNRCTKSELVLGGHYTYHSLWCPLKN